MAPHLFSTTVISLFLILSLVVVVVPVRSLSTVSISETSSNQTLICALQSLPDNNRTTSLNCTSFPSGIHIPQINNTIPYSGIVSGDGFVSALMSWSSVSVMVVWRFSSNGTNVDYKQIYKGTVIKELEAGNHHICGIFNGTDRLGCWQLPGYGDTVINVNLSTVAVGNDFTCGLSFGREIICSGSNSNITDHIPGGFYRSIEAGPRHACAISQNNSLHCWGDIYNAEGSENHPEGQFTSLALGENRTCALRLNETVTCWGVNNFEFELPAALRGISFATIRAKRTVFCGVSSSFSLYCWGNDYLDSNPVVFENVLPGPCMSSCPCAPYALSSNYCSNGYQVCQPCGGGWGEPPEAPSSDPSPLPSPPRPSPEPGGNGMDGQMVAFLVVGCVGSVSFLLVCFFLLFRYCKKKVIRIHDSGRLEEAEKDHCSSPSGPVQPVLEKRLSHLVSAGNGAHLEEFSLQVLAEATDNFSQEFKIGTGSFGSVYCAKLDDGRQVAIKRAEISTASPNRGVGGVMRRQEDRDRAFVNELESLSRLNHKNLVRLFGFCEDSDELILVYEYMDNGSLHDHLHRLSPDHSSLMSWPARLMVALDAARGIEYLHVYAAPPVIHRDIKSSNILLDSNWTAKVSDFGLSLSGPDDDGSHLSLHAAGTVGYVDPEYYRLQHLTPKSDVYSFGVVLLELLSGYRAIHKNENGVPRNVVDLVIPYIIRDEIHRVLDPKVPPPTPFEIEAVAYVGYLAADCVRLEGRDRPSSTEIVNCLERALTACLAQPACSPSLTGDHIDSIVVDTNGS
ncbi:hypothetical protein CDL15_Pgr018611 [Punica granatum]|uniref:Protein kinase domain-containing protein n=1 Tax=Punica granatum TaxID=22663 RepID=A0A218X133_PUNGR|nr:hypothetical protein CDL15_Pgr018611 [Punica granatum]